MSRGLGPIQKRIIDVLSYIDDPELWYSVDQIFDSIVEKRHFKWEGEEVVEVLDAFESREYQNRYYSIWRAIKSLEKRGFVRLEKIPKNERKFWSYARVKVFPTDKILSV